MGIQFTLGEKGLLKKLNQQVIDRLMPIVNVAVDEVVGKLSTRFSDGGIAPYDELKKMYDSPYNSKPHSRDMWTKRNRSSASTLSFEIRNRAKYARYIYSEESSLGHNLGFRSSYPHQKDAMIMKNGRLVRTGIKRPNQLSGAKWRQFIGNSKASITKAIKKGIK
jgi:hypothetical protein